MRNKAINRDISRRTGGIGAGRETGHGAASRCGTQNPRLERGMTPERFAWRKGDSNPHNLRPRPAYRYVAGLPLGRLGLDCRRLPFGHSRSKTSSRAIGLIPCEMSFIVRKIPLRGSLWEPNVRKRDSTSNKILIKKEFFAIASKSIFNYKHKYKLLMLQLCQKRRKSFRERT